MTHIIIIIIIAVRIIKKSLERTYPLEKGGTGFARNKIRSDKEFSKSVMNYQGNKIRSDKEFSKSVMNYQGNKIRSDKEFSKSEMNYQGNKIRSDKEFSKSVMNYQGNKIRSDKEFSKSVMNYQGIDFVDGRFCGCLSHLLAVCLLYLATRACWQQADPWNCLAVACWSAPIHGRPATAV